jgi:hypothetical protein
MAPERTISSVWRRMPSFAASYARVLGIAVRACREDYEFFMEFVRKLYGDDTALLFAE